MNRDEQTGFHISKESVDKVFSKKDIDILGYESPITVIMGQMRMEQENNIYKLIRNLGVDVDKEELIKALQYDRNQYEKGYINGYNRKASAVAREVIDEFERRLYCESHLETPITGYSYSVVDVDEIAYAAEELKKKYTECGE